MRIVVLDIAASKTGAMSVLRDFSEYVAEQKDGNEWIFITGVAGSVPQAGQIKSADELTGKAGIYECLRRDVKAGWGQRLRFEFISGASFVRTFKPDVVFSLENTMPRGNLKAKTVLYVHQPLGFQKIKNFSLFKKEERHLAVYQHFISHIIDSSIRRCDRVIVQTRWMREALIKKTGVSPDKVYALLPPLPPVPAGIKSGSFNPKSFIFPSGPIIYKNHECVIKAAMLLNSRGISDFKVSFTLRAEEAGDHLTALSDKTRDNIEWKGMISREELFDRYMTGTLIFPSYIETYGYPPAEARAVGGMVLSSDTPFCREVLEGYRNARFFDPFSPEELADLMQKVIEGVYVPEGSGGDSLNSGSWAEVIKVITA